MSDVSSLELFEDSDLSNPAKPILYEPILTNIRMSDQGYWVVTWSISPGRDLSVMLGRQGLTREEAAVEAWGMLPHTGADYLEPGSAPTEEGP